MKPPRRWFDIRLPRFGLLAVGIALAAVLVAGLPWILPASWFNGEAQTLRDRLAMLGIYGDMFGMLNATVLSLAFVAIYYTLRVQQKQHDL